MPSFDFKIVESNESDVEPKIRESTDNFGSHNIVPVSFSGGMEIKSYAPEKITSHSGVVYSEVIKKEFIRDHREASRFRLSDLVKGPLSVEAEEEARIEAEVRKRVDEKLTDVIDKATEEAKKKGFEEGLVKGKDEVLTRAKPSLEKLDLLINSFENIRTEVFKINEEFLIRIICQITKAVILRELETDKEYIQRLTESILERVGTKENIKLFVSETEFSSAEQIKQGLAQRLGQLKNISIELDSSIKQGGCRIETEIGEVDARIEVQVQNIVKSMTSA